MYPLQHDRSCTPWPGWRSHENQILWCYSKNVCDLTGQKEKSNTFYLDRFRRIALFCQDCYLTEVIHILLTFDGYLTILNGSVWKEIPDYNRAQTLTISRQLESEEFFVLLELTELLRPIQKVQKWCRVLYYMAAATVAFCNKSALEIPNMASHILSFYYFFSHREAERSFKKVMARARAS